MTLGLDDRSARLIHGRDVWTEIRDLLSGYSHIQAAIAFVGSDADQHLPLRGPATIVVNAGDEALRTGATDPDVLLRWSRRGVRVHSLPSLHAKVVLAVGNPSFVLVGSADVLSASGRSAHEAVLVADERETVDELREVIAEWKGLAGEPLTEAWLQAATSRYRPPVLHRMSTTDRGAVLPTAAGPLRPTGPVRPPSPDRAAAVPVLLPVRPSWSARPVESDRPQVPEPPRIGMSVPPERTGVAAESAVRSPAAPAEPPAEPMPARAEPFEAQAAPVQAHAEPVRVQVEPVSVAEVAATGQAMTDLVGQLPVPMGGVGKEGDEVGAAVAANSDGADIPDDAVADAADAAAADAHADAALTDAGAGDVDDDDDDGIEPVSWPRPKYIYLATMTRDGRPADSAVERLDQLRAEYRVPTSGRRPPVLDVQMFWWDEPARSGGRPSATYREGWHVVPISVPVSGRPAVLSAVDSPGRVLHSFTDYLASPARTYYYLLQHAGGPSTTFRKLREALTAVGEKPSYDHAYMMQHKVAAILDLWPQIGYDD